MRGLLTPAIIAATVLGLLGLLAWAARHGRPSPGAGRHTVLFRYTPLFRWFAYLAAFGVPVGLTLLVRAFPPRGNEVWYVTGVYLFFAGLSLPLVWEAARFYLLVTPAGVECRSPWRGLRAFAWDDIREVSFSPVNAWFVFHAENGDRIRASVFVAGLNDLLRLAEARLPSAALKRARAGYERVGRPFPILRDEPFLEARPPRP